MKSLNKFFVSIFILIFNSACLINVNTFARSWGYPGDCIRNLPSIYDLNSQIETTFIHLPLNLENLCYIIAEKTGETIPSEIKDQQLMVCRNLYILFSKDSVENSHYELKDVLLLLCENDEYLSWKIRPILEKHNYKVFRLLYKKFMNIPFDKPNKILTRADALLLLSYICLSATNQIQEEIPIFNVYEKLDLIINLKTIFLGTIYESILEIFPY